MTTLYDYIGDKDKKVEEERIKEEQSYNAVLTKIQRQKRSNVNFTGFEGRLSDLIDGIRTIPNYNNLKGYIREKVLPDNPEISYEKLSLQTGIHEGVALVILYDLYNDKLEEELKDLDAEDIDLDFRYE
ncbi:MAG: hypothetical protein KAU62_10225 [Candidatus Heimdallarchaeota archaeon]|nr:hypothetical protein [Candidatus Heimdallarchaeota archaeon]MCG3256454.1 hypothetical protein [Candidatus Heimdallarchaeota archaeon]MCK4611519.1 hypothetical protein [Candidatus Heimdallarchaeota archaeon]